jgi:hypothetical protein
MGTKLSLCLFLLILLPVFGHAQQPAKVVRWGSSNLPKECCNEWYKDGHLVTGYTDSDLEFVVNIRFDFDRKYMVAWIGAVNKSERSVNIDPSTFRFVVTDPEQRELPLIPTDQVAKDIEKRGNLLGFLTAFAAGMSTQTSTVQRSGNIYSTDGRTAANGTYNGTSTVTAPNVRARQQAAQQNAARQANNENKAAGIKYFALKLNTLFKGDMTSGIVFFKNAKLKGAVLSFTVDGVTYEIPYGSERTGKH